MAASHQLTAERRLPPFAGLAFASILPWNARSGSALLAIACIAALFAIASWSLVALRRARSARTRAQLELAASEARYRRTLDHARIGIARLSPDGRWLQVNQRLLEILGYDESELLARTYADVSHLEDLDIDVKQWELLRRGEIGDYAVERRFQARNGEIIHGDVRIAREEDDAGRLQHFILVLQDVTARKLSDGTRRVYERALAATQSGIVITDARRDDHPIVYANPAFTSITGYASAELTGKNCRILNEKARDQAALGELRAAIAGGSSCSVLLRNHKKSGEAFWNQLSIAPIEDTAGRLTHFVGVMLDVSELVQATAEREQLLSAAQGARKEAEAANRAKDRFLSVISHELRSPLNAILAWTSLLRDEPGDEVAKVVRAIEASVQSQSRLINELLDASRIREGTLQIEPVPVDLEAVVRNALTRLAPIASERGIALAFSGSGPAAAVADPERVEQIVRNLVDNALKFTAGGGHVDVTLSDEEGRWVIEVRDDGRGISADALPHVFQEFWQGDREASGHATGLGLGLLIVKHLVERHAGSVRIESAGRDLGTCVRVELPSAQESRPAPSATRDRSDLRGLEVIVVDDDDSVVHAIALALTRAGAICRPVASTSEALLHFQRGTPDALVSDIGLPDRDGFDLIRSVRASDEPNRSVLAIAVTGLVEPEDRRRIHRAGFDAYIPKPVAPDFVVERLASLRAQQAERRVPKRRVLLLGADPAITRCAEQLEKAGHAVLRVRGAAEAPDAAAGFRPHLVIARTCELDAAALADRLANRGIEAGVVGLGDGDPASDQNGFQRIIALDFAPEAIERSLRFMEDA